MESNGIAGNIELNMNIALNIEFNIAFNIQFVQYLCFVIIINNVILHYEWN